MAPMKTIGLVIFYICLLLPVLSVADNRVKLLPLDPLPWECFPTPYKINPKRPGYNMRGKIDSVIGNDIVINDALRFLTASTQVISMSDNTASKRILQTGRLVAFKLDGKNRILKIKVIKK